MLCRFFVATLVTVSWMSSLPALHLIPFRLILSQCLTPPFSLTLQPDTYCTHLQSVNISFLPWLWTWVPLDYCWPNGFLLHVCTRTLITLTDCTSVEKYSHTHQGIHAIMHACRHRCPHKETLAGLLAGLEWQASLHRLIHALLEDCIMHGPFASWIIKCNKDRVRPG